MKRLTVTQKSYCAVYCLSNGKRARKHDVASNEEHTQVGPSETDYHEEGHQVDQVPQIPSKNSAFVEPKRGFSSSVQNNNPSHFTTTTREDVTFNESALGPMMNAVMNCNIKQEFKEECDEIKCEYEPCRETILPTIEDIISKSAEKLLESKESEITSLKEMIDSKEKMNIKLREQLVKSLADKSELEVSNLDQMSQLDTEVYKLSAENVILKKSLETERNSWHSLKDKFDQLELRTSKVPQNFDPGYVNELEEKVKNLTKQNDELKLSAKQDKIELEKAKFLKGKYESFKQIYASNLIKMNRLENDAKHLTDKMETMKCENEILNLKLTMERDTVAKSNCEIAKMKNENHILKNDLKFKLDNWKLLMNNCEQMKQKERFNQVNFNKLNDQLKRLKEENVDLKKSLEKHIAKFLKSNQENVDLKKSFEDQNAKLLQSNQENVNLKKSLEDQSAKLQQSNQENVNLKKSFEVQNAKLQQSNQENANLKKSSDDQSAKLPQSSQENVAKLNNQIKQLKQHNQSNRNTIKQLSANNHEHRQMLAKVHDELAHLRHLLNALSEENAHLKAQLYGQLLPNMEETRFAGQFMY